MRFMKMIMAAALITVAWGRAAGAENIDLVTLPDRHEVQLTIYNSEDLTLVRETRYITVKKGDNRLQFSWAGTLIDPTSVEFRPLEHSGEIEVMDTVFPGDKPQHLVWNVRSEYEGQVKVEVSYFTSGLTWSMDYVGTAWPDDERMDFVGYVRVYNDSGEEYGGAEIRLIVGTVNLVEKIADLAKRNGLPVPEPASAGFAQLRAKAARAMFDEAEAVAFEAPQSAPKGIVKQGLSEYFMFTVDGKETVKNGWSKRMRAVKAEGLQYETVYRMREHQYGPRPVRFMIWKNDPDHELGESPLPNGLIRMFKRDETGALSFLGQQTVNYVPKGDEVEINLGPDDMVVFEKRKHSLKRFNFHFDRHGNVSGWDREEGWTVKVKNHHGRPLVFELREVFQGDVTYDSKMKGRSFDYRTVESSFTVKPASETEFYYILTYHMGDNAKQSRVKIK